MPTSQKNRMYNRPDVGPRDDVYTAMKMDKLSIMPLNTQSLLLQSQNTAYAHKNKYYTPKTLEEKKTEKLVAAPKVAAALNEEIQYFVKLRTGRSQEEFEELLRASPSLFNRFRALNESKMRAILDGNF